ncbi:MAG: nucleotidyltransferase domain-containing protein [Clostridia bacterium]|nr:nucleotidyltransferase domain-containing protein [Deltaproteobacteria bacterium]
MGDRSRTVDALITEALIELELDLVAGYLFGSAARDELRQGSDFDVAILTAGTALTPVGRWELEEQLAAKINRDVDLVDMRSASTVMQMQIISRGNVILDPAPSARHAYEGRVYADYSRLNEERKHILDNIRDRGTVHGR